jgi:DNA-binding HxlR family transcriptional regulator
VGEHKPVPKGDCPLIALIEVLGGRWKVMAMWLLRDGTKRFTELKKLMPGVTQKMLTQQLRQLESDGLIRRVVYPQVPPKVEYSLTPTGEQLGGLLVTLSDWAEEHMPALKTPKGKRRVSAAAK